MRKAVAYYRVSTGRQGRSGLGLAAQKRIVRQYCKAHNMVLVKEYTEVDSGRNGKRRKVNQAITYCRRHNITLYVATQSRLARSVLFIAILIDSGFDFISVDNPAANTLQKHIQAAFDQHTAEETSRNTKLSLAAAKKKGVKFGGNSKKRKRTIARKRKAFLKQISPVIRQIQKEFRTVRGITGELNRRKVKTFRGHKGGWHVSTVHKIMCDLSLKK